uniref:Xylulose kinase-1 n=1 Tax=Tanacetum cinerariifolium TaxID=118510 RepID=A0A699H8T3_TANCI|nr:hypothetical protein [Tanacetum cinerariifolium]
MARLAFCDYQDIIAILEKSEHNIDFHQIVDFIEASHIRYALTINPTIYVSHIQQFWSTARIETTNKGTKILATVDDKPRTIFESLIRRNLKLNDEEGISSLPDAELFENLALMGVNSLSFSGRTVPLFATMLVTQGEGLGTPTEPHHTPSPEAQQSPHPDLSSSLHPTKKTETSPTETPTEIPILRQYFKRATWITQFKALPTAADKPASLFRDDSQGEAFPTVSGLEAGQDRENIIKTSALPHDSTPRVTSLAADEGTLSGDDAPIMGRSLETGEEAGVERSTKQGSNDTKELVNVLTSLDAANILTSGVQAVSVPPVSEIPTVGVPTGSGLVPTVSAIFTTASVVTPYSRRKGKDKMVESDTPKKKKLQEQIDIQMAREIEEEMARDAQRINEQIARDAKIARIHAKEELQMLINGLDRNNEAQQSKPLSKKQQREFYMSVLRSHSGWKTKHFRGMTLEEIREKFIHVWKQIKDFVPMASKEEGEKVKRKGLNLEQGNAKRMKTSEDVSEEDLKEMMQLVHVEEVYVEALQVDRKDLNQLWMLVKETLSIKQASSDKEKELWVELKRLFKPDHEDQLWTHTQALMHDPLEWKLYDTCGGHHIFTRD